LVSLTDLQATVGTGEFSRAVVLGLAEGDSGPLRHNLLGRDPHLIVYGEGRSGKTTVLRSLLTQLLEAETSSTAEMECLPEIVIVDYRRDLAVGAGGRTPSALTVATNPEQAVAACGSVAATLARRITEQRGIRHRAGPNLDVRTTDVLADHPSEIYLLVDDYDLVATTAGNPLLALLPYLPHGADIGFHLVLTRRTGGAARAQYEALLQSLGDLGTPVLMLSGSPTEGRLAHGLVPRLLPAGRARFVTRSAEPQMVQTAWVAPDPPD
jgi:S-DNA-T family DNA segregation ATPase FtsK/SpoIIIE